VTSPTAKSSRGALGKHLRVAEWFESLGRPEDHAELLAHHSCQRPRIRAGGRRDEDGTCQASARRAT
jgi:hypothetical protein